MEHIDPIAFSQCGFVYTDAGELVLRFIGANGQVADIPAFLSMEAVATAVTERIEAESGHE